MQVGEGSYSQAVGRMELSAQELAAGFFHLVQLEQAGGGQQRLSRIKANSRGNLGEEHAAKNKTIELIIKTS